MFEFDTQFDVKIKKMLKKSFHSVVLTFDGLPLKLLDACQPEGQVGALTEKASAAVVPCLH